MSKNFDRMLDLVNTFFDTRNDPDQISVTEVEREKLGEIHSATLSEQANDDGPIVWILIIPTTKDVMERFLSAAISERQLLEQTQPEDDYQSIYLCSASVLPEFRKKGLAKTLTINAIRSVRAEHNITSLFYWPFSEEGRALAHSIANELGLDLLERTDQSNLA
jgi:ribosomal protein S18 acetylase RimI-like enzyme